MKLVSKLMLAVFVVCLMSLGNGAVKGEAADKVTVYLVGDSTVAHYKDDSQKYKVWRCGWGDNIGKHFDESKVQFVNLAMPGHSDRSFTYMPNYQTLLQNLKKGDYLFVQFGHNDTKNDDPKNPKPERSKVHTNPVGDETKEGNYQYYLYKYYIKAAQDRGAIPVLVTPMARMYFVNGSINENVHYSKNKGEDTISYDDSMRALAKKYNITLLDLKRDTTAMYNMLGLDKSIELQSVCQPNYQNGKIDKTHTNAKGSAKVADCVAREIAQSNLELKKYMK